MSNKICVLAECIERDISMIRFPTLKDAQQAMFQCYLETLLGGKEAFDKSEYAKMSFPECIPEIQKNEELFAEEYAEITPMWAYITDGPNHDNFDWKIEEI